MITLENEFLVLKINELGAEVTSVINKKNNKEYLWQSDENIWKSQSPLLFPIVGRLGKYKFDGKEYEMNSHGFARNTVFEVEEQTSDKCVFSLTWNNDTLAQYPFKFKLFYTYCLVENSFSFEYHVHNLDEKQMLYSIGAHPGFICPLNNGETYEDYYLEFEKSENLVTKVYDPEAEQFTGENRPVTTGTILNLKNDIFDSDALVFENINSRSVTLKSNKNSNYVKMEMSDKFKQLAFWAKQNCNTYICFEPWNGYGNCKGFDGNFENKQGLDTLEVVGVHDYKLIFTIA